MSLMAHASEIIKAARIYQRFAPPALARISRVANLRAGIVIIHTEHGAAANKLKQQTSYLIDEFVKNGLECNAIEIRVQPSGIREVSSPARQKPLSERALTSLETAAKEMRPGSPLKARLEHLLEHVAKR